MDLSKFADLATNFQKRNTARILLVVVLLTTSSVFLAGTKLETSFELTDFLSEEDMPIMEARKHTNSAAHAWIRAFSILRVALTKFWRLISR